MPEPEMTDKSLRHRILLAIQDAFRAVGPDPDLDPDDLANWPFTFSTVAIGPVDSEDHRKRYSLGIVPTKERYQHTYPYQERFLRVSLEFRVTANRGDPDPGELFEQCITVMERVVQQNRTWGGLAIDTDLEDSDSNLITWVDRSVYGMLMMTVHFRHATNDSRNPAPVG